MQLPNHPRTWSTWVAADTAGLTVRSGGYVSHGADHLLPGQIHPSEREPGSGRGGGRLRKRARAGGQSAITQVIFTIARQHPELAWHPPSMQDRTYRLEVEGELSDIGGWTFEGMSLTHDQGRTVLEGLVRDQAELHGLLQRVSGLGLTLLSVNAIDRGP